MARITVEDCLENVANRFELVMMASKRARQLMRGSAEPKVAWENDKATVVALREIAGGYTDFSDAHYADDLVHPTSTAVETHEIEEAEETLSFTDATETTPANDEIADEHHTTDDTSTSEISTSGESRDAE